KLSTFFGVVVPCCLSMFSVILFLRMGFIVGQAGMLESLAMLVLAYAIIGFTVLSICAISTNGAIEGGGAYFMISRALGPEFGGSIGLMFFLANVASTALYIFGLVEAMLSFFGPEGQLVPYHGKWWSYLYGSIILLVCLIVCVVGADIYAKTTFLIFVVVMVCIASIFISFNLTSNSTLSHAGVLHLCNQTNVTYTGFNQITLENNIKRNTYGYCRKSKCSIRMMFNTSPILFISSVVPHFTIDYTTSVPQNFIKVFAVLFNGCTGIMAGANMSGDLKNPSRSIPVGTISACIITFLVYMALIILISATTPRWVAIVSPVVTHTLNLFHTPPHTPIVTYNDPHFVSTTTSHPHRILLFCNYSFLLTINLWSPFVAIGVFASSLSAALSCLIGASRILYALARDDLFGMLALGVKYCHRRQFEILSDSQHPLSIDVVHRGAWGIVMQGQSPPKNMHSRTSRIILRPMTKTTSSGNPIVAVLFSWFLVQMTLFIGQVNTIAPIVTIFFLISYAATDLACLALEWASAPNFRPTFKLFTWHTCVLGFISCVVMMFLVQALYTSISVVVLIVLLIIIHYRVPTSSWGYISQALIFHQVRKYMLMLDVRKEHVKFWRPQILLMIKNPRTSCQLIRFINSIKKSGLYVLGNVTIGSLAEMSSDQLSPQYNHWLNLVDEIGVKAFVELTLSKSVREGTEHLLRISGLGGMKPNTLVLGFHDNQPRTDTFQDLGISVISSIISNDQPLEDAFDSGSFFPSVESDDDDDGDNRLSPVEYVSIISDAIKLHKNVCLARCFNQLNTTKLAQDKGKIHYIDVWPVNFLSHFRGRSSTSYFDTTCVFLMQMACILNMTPFWKNRTKLRIFLFTETNQELGDEELVVRGCRGDVIGCRGDVVGCRGDVVGCRGDVVGCRGDVIGCRGDVKMNSLIRSQHQSTAVTFLYLPTPPTSTDQCEDYLDMLTQISDGLGPTLFVHGLSHVISTTL
uniref:Solute carrier family 12 member 9 n=1 Tax=Ciona savignyi TaxID=51511 RepID=H2Y8I5_CIOSA